MKYNEIVSKAKNIKKVVESEYRLPESTVAYYIAKAIQTKKDVKDITVNKADRNNGDYISDQIRKSDYLDMIKRFTTYVEKNHKLPSSIMWDGKKVKLFDYVYAFARILVYYDANKKLPGAVNVNSKAFTKPVETSNVVYDYFTKKTGKRLTTLDDILTYVKNNFKYQYYYNDYKSNKEVTDTKSGNCTDLLQWLCNMVEALGYEWKCIHVKCRKSGGGHVFGKFRHPKNTSGNWIVRDIACVADGGNIKCVWCSDGTVVATNPSWWLSNLHR